MSKVISHNTELQSNVINPTENNISTIPSYQISPDIGIFNPVSIFIQR